MHFHHLSSSRRWRAYSERCAPLLTVLLALGCTREDDEAAASGGTGGLVVSLGGASASGATSVTGGSRSDGTARGGQPSGAGGTSGGSSGQGSIRGGAMGAAAAGAGGQAGLGGGSGGPPGAAADGKSPYTVECHGDSLDCHDPALRCLGIRDATQIYGYGCSNPCDDESDCSTVSSGTEAKAGCVDFVSQRHCLLVCQTEDTEFGCPRGMQCYLYPGTSVGYCLWR